jgi:hydrogenase 3 maturation protease
VFGRSAIRRRSGQARGTGRDHTGKRDLSMDDPSQEIRERLKGRRFGVIGVGNILRGDDGAGPALAAALAERNFTLPVVDASEVPENYGSWPVKLALECVVFVDAVDFGGAPGAFRIIPLEKLMVSASSTHRLSLHYTIEYLENEWEGQALLIGVQPKDVRLGEGLSAEVAGGVGRLADVLNDSAS